MRAEDIKPGMWLRYVYQGSAYDGCPVRALHARPFSCRLLDGAVVFLPVDYCEPWTPRVGEWVRLRGGTAVAKWDGPFCVVCVNGDVTAVADCGLVTATASEFEPCLPPKSAPADGEADRLSVGDYVTVRGFGDGVVERVGANLIDVRCAVGLCHVDPHTVERVEVAAPPPKPCDCPRCTGPVATLLTMPCQGADWRQAEPEVVEGWTSRPNLLAGAVEMVRERVYNAHGVYRGKSASVVHPIREEAIRRWREAVR